MRPSVFAAAVPALFVTIWSTGFVVARLVAPHVEPFTFLSFRFTGAAGAMALLAVLAGSTWPRRPADWGRAALAGLLLQGVYLCCAFWAVAHGLPAAIAALVAGAQPLLTAMLSGPLLGESVSGRRWVGVAVGTLGIALVVGPRLGQGDAVSPVALLVAGLGTAAITVGTFWQKKHGGGRDVAPDTAIQFASSLPLTLLLAWLFESGRVDAGPAFWIGLLWAVCGLSTGAIGLFLLLLRRGAVVGVASLMFLVPPVTALISLWLFGDTLLPVQLFGMAVAVAGLVLATRH